MHDGFLENFFLSTYSELGTILEVCSHQCMELHVLAWVKMINNTHNKHVTRMLESTENMEKRKSKVEQGRFLSGLGVQIAEWASLRKGRKSRVGPGPVPSRGSSGCKGPKEGVQLGRSSHSQEPVLEQSDWEGQIHRKWWHFWFRCKDRLLCFLPIYLICSVSSTVKVHLLSPPNTHKKYIR